MKFNLKWWKKKELYTVDLAEKQCANCGKTFKPKHPSEKYCSEECRAVKRKESQALWMRNNYRKARKLDEIVKDQPELTDEQPQKEEKKINKMADTDENGMRACVECGTLFKPTHYKQVTCSDKCRGIRYMRQRQEWSKKDYELRKEAKNSVKPKTRPWQTERACISCGKMFVPEHPNQTICSKECRATRIREARERWREKATGIKTVHAKTAYRDGVPYTPPIKTCPVCGKEFACSNNHQKYCSIQCRDSKYKANYKLKYVPVDHDEKQCEICGKMFHPIMRTAKYCSKDCYRKSGLISKSAYIAEIYKQEQEEKDIVKEAQKRARENYAKRVKSRDIIVNKSNEAAPVVRKLVNSGMPDDVVAKYLQTLFGGR